MRHVVFVLPSLRGGGAERVFLQLANELSKTTKVSLLLFMEEGPFMDLVEQRVSIHSLAVERARYAYRKLKKVLLKLNPDVVFSTHDRVNVMLGLMKKSLPNHTKVFLRQTNVLSLYLLSQSNFKRVIKKYFFSYSYQRADAIIAQCQEMKEDLIKTLPQLSKPIHVIYNPINQAFIEQSMVEFNPYKSYDEKIIVASGRLSEQKDFRTLIQAFEILHRKDSKTRLFILGDGPLRDDLSRLVNDVKLQNVVHFTGFVNNPYPYYHFADVFVLSSKYEGFPNVLLEALTTNVKVVATNCPTGVKEIMNQASLSHLTVTVGDFKSMSEKIVFALNQSPNVTIDMSRYYLTNISGAYFSLMDVDDQ